MAVFFLPILHWTDIILANLAVILGATLQGSVGFGLGFVGAPLLMLISPSLIPGPLLLNAVVLTLLLTHRERHSIVFSEIKWAVVGRFVGVTIAAAFVASISTDGLALSLGILVLVLVGLSLSGLRFPPNWKSLIVAGTMSGFAGTIASVGAPPMAIVYQHESGPRIRGTLSAFFVIGTVMSLGALIIVGRLGAPEVALALKMLPGLLLGFAISRRLALILDRGHTRNAVLMLASMGGLVLVLRELL
jgi:uncharacterized membrane protein YfcA